MPAPRKHDTDAILDATRALALRDGPRGVSVAAIARASGAPAGTLYHRFGNRDGVLAAAWMRALGRFQEGALRAAAPHEDPVERGVAVAVASISFARAHPEDAHLLLSLRRDDLLDAAPGDALLGELAALNAPLEAEVGAIARALHGRASARSLDRVVRAVVDVPYAAVRRHAGELPGWLEDDVASACRALLTS